ncbi:uncharacterized protein C8A04DRAFT_24874 [Dichotomopilus funicola]|uniref:Uncharacterized protein n=1 Tax=Dichotomopilus funicola TaxID=1934379 RepID=A0AAN6ZS38_9PEZI|nr:hypothetical protein C8A04DRAFT_24874 [Dichotomopilus funicola]
MASVRLLVLPRGGDASHSDSSEGASTLTTGAIAGIACGAGALFLGAAGLFIIYWRRQRRYDREDDSDCDSFDGERRGDMVPAVTYTMDYKMDGPQPEGAGDHASSYAYSPEKVLSPMSTSDTASAMPTHPAYIPRVLVRGSSTPSNRSARTTSPPPFPTPPFPSGDLYPKTQPDDTIIQAYLAAAQAGTPPPHVRQQLQLHQQQQQQHYRSESESSSSGLPIQHPAQFPPISAASTPPPLPPQPHSASSTDASQHPLHPDHQTRATSGPQLPSFPYPYPQHLLQQQEPIAAGPPSQPNRKPRAYPPPPLNLADPSSTTTSTGPIGPTRSKSEKPLHGKLGTTISGPLAFPHLVPGTLPTTNTTPSGWSREEGSGGISHDSSHGDAGADDSTAEGQHQQKRSFRSRAWGFASGGGSGGDGSGGGKGDDNGKGKEKKHRRKRSNRNSGGGGGGGGGYAGNRHYAEIEIGRESDLW